MRQELEELQRHEMNENSAGSVSTTMCVMPCMPVMHALRMRDKERETRIRDRSSHAHQHAPLALCCSDLPHSPILLNFIPHCLIALLPPSLPKQDGVTQGSGQIGGEATAGRARPGTGAGRKRPAEEADGVPRVHNRRRGVASTPGRGTCGVHT